MRQSVYNPLQGAGAPGFQNELRQLFNGIFQAGDDRDVSSVVTSQWVPRVDIQETAERFVIYVDLPGIDPADVEVLMDKGVLSIRGERRNEIGEERGKFSRMERRCGSFHRRFALPDSADPEGITASGHNGVLEIGIPKRPETTPRRIQVGKPAPLPTRQ